MNIIIKSVEDIGHAAKEFVTAMGDSRIFAFYGKMGAGKTTFIKAICAELGVKDTVTSPTFAIVNEYATSGGDTVYHFDFYRLRNLSEAVDMGCDEYFFSGSPCFIEWPELIEDILPEEAIHVSIEEQPDGSRNIRL